MAGGPKKHLKRIATPKHWCLDKLSGVYAPKPSAGPHKLRECVPLAVLLRNKLKYALSYDEVKLIVMQRLIKIDQVVRTDRRFPVGFQDVVSIEKCNEHFRMLYDTKGRFVAHRVKPEEAQYKLCRVRRVEIGSKGIPYAYFHDGRTLRYPHPDVKVNDTIKYDLANKKALDHFSFGVGALVMIVGGHSCGRIGTVTEIKSTPGSKKIVHCADAAGAVFTTVSENVFVIGSQNVSAITLEEEKGVRKSIVEEQSKRYTVFA
uniref:40S ribosomal protein S4 n=1 Tax=Dermatophagoides pteronyssinus TaxID=6956 RepID=A0A6P6Y785_DERPT|nr:40S ribosomal protein S4-like [Dermatophagoides pteronyssinus]